MIKFASRNFCLFLLALFASFQFAEAKPATARRLTTAPAQAKRVARDASERAAIAKTNLIVREIVEKSYPELSKARIKIKTFDSRADYFRSRFSFSRFLTFRRLNYLILVNLRIFGKTAPPDEAVRAIIAHELAHIVYYERHNRFELLGLIGLLTNSRAARFERGADLEAIRRGYGAGLKEYRRWLYQNIPTRNLHAKKRDYFSPEEIDLITDATGEKPALFDFWRKNIPRNLNEIRMTSDKIIE